MVNAAGPVMASAARVLANRSNAQKSTGPRTVQGKAVVAQNALKHGLLAQEVVIKGEDPGEFEFYRNQMLGELAPVGQVESMLAARVVSLSWRLQRADRPAGEPGREDAELTLGRVVVKDYSNARVLDRLLMYERRIELSLYRTMGELQKQRVMREADPPVGGTTAEGGVTSGEPAWGERPFDKLRACPPRQSNGEGSFLPEEVARGRPTYQEPPEGGTPNESRETNPIGAGSNGGQVLFGTGVRNDSCQNEIGKTNPIGGRGILLNTRGDSGILMSQASGLPNASHRL
jgi:hypothetical protein